MKNSKCGRNTPGKLRQEPEDSVTTMGNAIKVVRLILSFMIMTVSTLSAKESQTLTKQEFYHYCFPVREAVALSMEQTAKKLNIDLYELFFLLNATPHSRDTTKLVKDKNHHWRLEFTAVPANAAGLFLHIAQMSGLRDDKGVLAKQEMLSDFLHKRITEVKSYSADLERLRKVEEETKKRAAQIWSVKGDGEE